MDATARCDGDGGVMTVEVAVAVARLPARGGPRASPSLAVRGAIRVAFTAWGSATASASTVTGLERRPRGCCRDEDDDDDPAADEDEDTPNPPALALETRSSESDGGLIGAAPAGAALPELARRTAAWARAKPSDNGSCRPPPMPPEPRPTVGARLLTTEVVATTGPPPPARDRRSMGSQLCRLLHSLCAGVSDSAFSPVAWMTHARRRVLATRRSHGFSCVVVSREDKKTLLLTFHALFYN